MPSTLSQNLQFLYIYPFKAISNGILHIAKMKEEKSYYEAPATTVMEVKMESSLLYASLDATRNGYGDAIEESWGGA